LAGPSQSWFGNLGEANGSPLTEYAKPLLEPTERKHPEGDGWVNRSGLATLLSSIDQQLAAWMELFVHTWSSQRSGKVSRVIPGNGRD
jgi:hypothetical protein